MSTLTCMKTLFKVAAGLGLAGGAYVALVRPRMMRWGNKKMDLDHPLPGARIIPGGKWGATMAVTIDAPPSRVWPWLAQMGFDRAGWYSYDWLDNLGHHSAGCLQPVPRNW